MDQSTYPQLLEYIKGAALADTIRKYKRPVTWIRLLGAVGIAGSLLTQNTLFLWFLVPIFLVVTAIDFQRLRRSMSDGAAITAGQSGLTRLKLKSLITSRKLESVLGAETVQELERCASSARKAMATIVSGSVDPGKPYNKPTKESLRLSSAIEAAMDTAFRAVWKPLAFKWIPDTEAIAQISEVANSLERLVSALEEEARQVQPAPMSPLGEAIEEIEARAAARLELGQG